jgi:hypothetical protein
MSQKQRILDLLEDVRAEVEDLELPEMVAPSERVPMQPLVMDGPVVRFRQNAIVEFLRKFAASHGMDMNELARMDFPREDAAQFAQLIGYSVSGYGELSYALGFDEAWEAAQKFAELE